MNPTLLLPRTSAASAASTLVRALGAARRPSQAIARLAVHPTATRALGTEAANKFARSVSSFPGEEQPDSLLGGAPLKRRYAWVSAEAEKLIAEAYELHTPERPFPPTRNLSNEELEKLNVVHHYDPKTFSDRVALKFTDFLFTLMNLFFRDKHDHHAVTLETVAAVPGMTAAVHRHFRSLRWMSRDHAWVDSLYEEANNERMHLLHFLSITQPTAIERAFVILAQLGYASFYGVMYIASPRTAHRMVGYLEECAVKAYNEYIEAIDHGKLPNPVMAPNSLAVRYWKLPPNSTLRDVLLRVRGDEQYHALFNHGLSDLASEPGGLDKIPTPIGMQAELELSQKRLDEATGVKTKPASSS